jgi:predicted secreted protein
MSTNAISAHGTLLKMADRATHITYATIAEVNDIKGPQIKGVREDATSHSSGGWAEKISTLKEAGKVTFDVNFISSDVTHNKTLGLIAASIAQTKEYFQVVYPDNSGFQFYAFVDMNFEAKVRGKLTASIDLELTGAITPL